MEWTGDEKAEKPHSFTTIAKGTSLTGEHGEVSSVEKNEGTSNMQLIAIVLSILAIVSSVGTCVLWYVVKISNNDKKEPTISRLLLNYFTSTRCPTASAFGFIFTKQILTTINNSPMNKLIVMASCKKIELNSD